jgi:hypothetical protein
MNLQTAVITNKSHTSIEITYDLVIIRETIELQGMQVQENVVAFSYRMRISVCIRASALKILSTNETSINVNSSQRN